MSFRNEQQSEILDVLRRRICLHFERTPLVFHEATLAKEFGVSRTPIRDVLLTLSMQQLVITRPGIGTIAPPLVPGARQSELRVYVHLARAASECSEGLEIDGAIRGGLIGQMSGFDLSPNRGSDTAHYVETMGGVINALGDLVVDPILRDAMKGAHWRFVRWRAAELHARQTLGVLSLNAYVARLLGSIRVGYVSHTLDMAADLAERQI